MGNTFSINLTTTVSKGLALTATEIEALYAAHLVAHKIHQKLKCLEISKLSVEQADRLLKVLENIAKQKDECDKYAARATTSKIEEQLKNLKVSTLPKEDASRLLQVLDVLGEEFNAQRTADEDISNDGHEETVSDATEAQADAVKKNYTVGSPLQIARRAIATKIQLWAGQTRDVMADVVKKWKELGVIDVAKAMAMWIKNNPWTTAAIVAFLLSLVITPIVLSAMGFTTVGIAAGTHIHNLSGQGVLLTSFQELLPQPYSLASVALLQVLPSLSPRVR